MQYRILGKTRKRVSEIGVGGHQRMVPASSLPEDQAASWKTHFDGLLPEASHRDRAQVVKKALDLGVNYFDTSLDPETESFGQSVAILERRNECVTNLVAGVFQYMGPSTAAYWAKKAVQQDIDRGLELFGYDHFEVCLTCMCNNWYGHKMLEGAFAAMEAAKEAGKIGAAGISDHQDGEFLAYVIERYHDQLDVVMYPFNYVRRDAAKKLFPLIKKYNIGFIAMKPFNGGKIFADPKFQRYVATTSDPAAVAALRWVLQHEEVSVALGAVNSISEIEQNCTASC